MCCKPPSIFFRLRYQTYWIYWVVLFVTPLTWVFTVVAAVTGEWMVRDDGEVKRTEVGFDTWFCLSEAHIDELADLSEIHGKDVHDEICSAGESRVLLVVDCVFKNTIYETIHKICLVCAFYKKTWTWVITVILGY